MIKIEVFRNAEPEMKDQMSGLEYVGPEIAGPVLHPFFRVLRFPTRMFGPSNSDPPFITSDIWSFVLRSYVLIVP